MSVPTRQSQSYHSYTADIKTHRNLIQKSPQKQSFSPSRQEAHHKVGLGKTPRCLIRKCCRYSSLQKFEDAFDTALLPFPEPVIERPPPSTNRQSCTRFTCFIMVASININNPHLHFFVFGHFIFNIVNEFTNKISSSTGHCTYLQ